MPPDEAPMFPSNRPWERRTIGRTAPIDVTYGIDSRWWTLGIGLSAIIVDIVVGKFDTQVRAEVAGGSVGAILLVWIIFNKSHKAAWLWVFLSACAIVHAVAYFTAPWPIRHRQTRSDVFFVQIDVIVMCGIAALLKWLARRKVSQH